MVYSAKKKKNSKKKELQKNGFILTSFIFFISLQLAP